MAIVRSRLFIVVATALALGILGYLAFEAGLFSNNQMPIESSVSPSITPPPTSPRLAPTASQLPLSAADGAVTK